MLDNVNSGMPAFFNPGGEKANKLEKMADGLLWAPRQMLGDRTVKVMNDDGRLQAETHRDTAMSTVKNFVGKQSMPVKVFVASGYGLLCVLTSPILLVSGVIGSVAKGIALATSGESKLRMKAVQAHLKAEGAMEKKDKLEVAQKKLAAAINEKIGQINENRSDNEKLPTNSGAYYAQGFVDLAKGRGDEMKAGFKLELGAVSRAFKGLSNELTTVNLLARDANRTNRTIEKTTTARQQALRELDEAYNKASRQGQFIED